MPPSPAGSGQPLGSLLLVLLCVWPSCRWPPPKPLLPSVLPQPPPPPHCASPGTTHPSLGDRTLPPPAQAPWYGLPCDPPVQPRTHDLAWNPHLPPALRSTRPLSLKPTWVRNPRCLMGLLQQMTTDTHALAIFTQREFRVKPGV